MSEKIGIVQIQFHVGNNDKDVGEYFHVELIDRSGERPVFLEEVDEVGKFHKWDRSQGRSPGICDNILFDQPEKHGPW